MRHATVIVSLALALEGCGGAAMHEVQLINKSPRPITEVFVFPMGASDRGPSKGTIAPEAKLVLKVKAGNVDFLAVSQRVKLDDKQSEVRTASQTLELKSPMVLVFHDSTQTVPGLDKPGTIGVQFQVPPEADPPAPAPGPTAP